MSQITFQICTADDALTIVEFLWSIRADLRLSERSDIWEITELLFEKGGVIVGYKNDQVIGVLGYFLGEPSRNYANKEVGFIYFTAIAKVHRMTRFFSQGLRFTMELFQEMGLQTVRFHAGEDDRYTNRLYSHFAKPVGKELNRRGHHCILYENTIDNVLTYVLRHPAQKQTAKYSPTPGAVPHV